MNEAIFVPDGEMLVPTDNAAGPWFPGVVHGGAITGLMARAIEAAPSAGPMMTTRMSVDMTRKVPMAPAVVEATILRDGRRVQSLECDYRVDGETVARATAIRVRVDPAVVPAGADLPVHPEDAPPAGPETMNDLQFEMDGLDFVRAFTMRRTEPAPGVADTWVRLDREFVAGEEVTPLMRLAIAADMIPSAGSLLDFHSFLSVNPDLSINVGRLPHGEWIGSRAVTRVQPGGFGQTDATLYDQTGAIGRSVKSLLIDRR